MEAHLIKNQSMNQKKIKILLYLPLGLLFIANIFYFPIVAQAACSYNSTADGSSCGKIGKISNTLTNCTGQTVPSTCSTNINICECCCDSTSAADTSNGLTGSSINTTMPKLQITIPNLTFSSPVCQEVDGQKSCEFPWIGEYIAAIYKYAIGIVGILAAIVLMIGGVMWIIAGGNPTTIGEAKSWIGASLTGLILALCSYLILYQINPALVNFKSLKIGIVKQLEELTTEYTNAGCPSSDDKSKGFEALITGYCRPSVSSYSSNKTDFLCAVGLNCSCPSSGRSKTASCCNSKNYCWKPCNDFNPSNTEYCNGTASGGAPGVGQVAADWSCFSKGSTINIQGLGSFTVTDKGSAIKGRRFDVWVDDCNQAKTITKTYSVTSN